jgi:hypothetical protein
MSFNHLLLTPEEMAAVESLINPPISTIVDPIVATMDTMLALLAATQMLHADPAQFVPTKLMLWFSARVAPSVVGKPLTMDMMDLITQFVLTKDLQRVNEWVKRNPGHQPGSVNPNAS